jgi:hypothetical protein
VQDDYGRVSDLHLEWADLGYTHLETLYINSMRRLSHTHFSGERMLAPELPLDRRLRQA